MDKFKQNSLDAEIERYTKQMMSDYQRAPVAAAPPQTAAALPAAVSAAPPEPPPPTVAPPVPKAERPPAATPAQEFERFAAENPQRGSIKAQALTARGTYPVKDVTVVISKLFESGEYIISTQRTDIAGKTEPVAVPAPDVDLSEAPGQQLSPFSTYRVTFTHPSFATTVSQQLPVFSGTTAMQTVNLVPISAAPNGSSTIEYITTEPSDL